MKVFVPRRLLKNNEENPPEPSVKSAKSLPVPPFGTFDQPEQAQLQKKNTLESSRDPIPAALEIPRDQPRPAAIPVSAAALEPSIFAAMLGGLPEALGVMREDRDRVAWLQVQTPGGEWITGILVETTSRALGTALERFSTRYPDAVAVTLHSLPKAPHAGVNPARGYAPIRAYFSRKEVSA